MTTINETFAAILKRHKTLFVTIVTILSIVGSIISILQAGSVKWSDAVIGMNILVWLIAVSVIQYNKLNKLNNHITATARIPKPGEYVYIDGEDEAMSALIAATKRGRSHIRATRYFPCPIHGRHPEYSTAIHARVLGGDGQSPLRSYSRIVSANNPNKLTDVKEYIRQFHGKSFHLYLTHKSNGFELVVIDDKETFIHFYGKDAVIGSTLYIPGLDIAHKFRDVFDRLKDLKYDDTIMEINCQYIKDAEIETWVKKAEEFFDSHRTHMNADDQNDTIEPRPST